MKKITSCFLFFCSFLFLFSCTEEARKPLQHISYNYPNLLALRYTPDSPSEKGRGGQGLFTDQGAWMGFTLPAKQSGINGFCGPFDIDRRHWLSRSVACLSVADSHGKLIDDAAIKQDTAICYPGSVVLKANVGKLKLSQQMVFVSAQHALVRCKANKSIRFAVKGSLYDSLTQWHIENRNQLRTALPSGEQIVLTFPRDMKISVEKNSYTALSLSYANNFHYVISYFNSLSDFEKFTNQDSLLNHSDDLFHKSLSRWDGYISENLRSDMPNRYNRIMVKSIMTIMSNWRSPKGALHYNGVVPSHAMNYFVGFWAWDSWKHSVALSFLDNRLAKDQLRAMFDYQQPDGMIPDCIFTDSLQNNNRDTKPPLSAWALKYIYEADHDSAFVAEMYPKILKYNRWWYKNRDHNRNGICEYGSTDGTILAARWESGMDNAVRFDNSKMLKNNAHAWSMDQESVDLNTFLVYESDLLAQLAPIAHQTYTQPNDKERIANYFFDTKDGYFYDRKLSGQFIRSLGPEGWLPLWTRLATPQQAARVYKVMADTTKFSTYIPFPTINADNPKFSFKGYWRGPIWLDQVYFAISGLRNYGYNKQADAYTRQVFDRLEGISKDGAIRENYDPHTGRGMEAQHFSWSAVHLLLLYKEYGK